MKKYLIQFIIIQITILFVGCSDDTEESNDVSENKIEVTGDLSGADGGVVVSNSIEIELPEGPYEVFYENGQLQVSGQVIDGKRSGLWIAYHPNGNKQSENNYKAGILEGKSFVMYPNGQMMYIGYFANGKYDGQWLYFNEEGKTVKEIIYKNGEVVQTTEGDQLPQL